jgi:DNA-binding PadR family transcriptional regulator
MTNYIATLVQEGLIDLTMPDTPRDPRQMYQTTEKGRKILESQDCPVRALECFRACMRATQIVQSSR